MIKNLVLFLWNNYAQVSVNYPENHNITHQRKACFDLEASRDWDALEWAKSDLHGILKKREVWLKNNEYN